MSGIRRTPRERWGTCCPFDPECSHSYMDEDELEDWLDTYLTDAQATAVDFNKEQR